MRLKVAAFVGLGALIIGLGFTACGDPQRSTYVRYTPSGNSGQSAAPSPTASAT